MSASFLVFLGDVYKQDCNTKLSISSLSGHSFLVGTWLSGSLISLIKIAFENSSSDKLLMDLCKSGGGMASEFICEALRVTTFSVSGECITHIIQKTSAEERGTSQ